MSQPDTTPSNERSEAPPPAAPRRRRMKFVVAALAAFFFWRAYCGPIPRYDARFERLARNLEHAMVTLRGPIPSTYGIDDRALRLLKDAEFRAGDVEFAVGGGVRRRVCAVRDCRVALSEDVFALWEECYVPPSDATWPVRVVRLRSDGIDTLGDFEIPSRLCPGRWRIDVPAELREWGSFWTYGQPSMRRCPTDESRRLDGTPSLIRVDLRESEIEVFPLSCLWDVDETARLELIFWDEELRRFYGTIDVSPDFIFGKPPEAPIVLREDLTGIEASLKR